MQDELLDKTLRINLLFDFYQQLLTEKQQTFLQYYFHDNYSLGEIAVLSGISRQAVFEHIKRAEHILEQYELKLKLLQRHERRRELIEQLRGFMPDGAGDAANIGRLLDQLERLE